MALVSLKEILQDARAAKYAVPMFDVANPQMIRMAVEVAEELNSPVILAAIEPDLVGNRLNYWANAANYAAINAKVPVAYMLDHATNFAICKRCAEAGFTGVMLDASSKEFDENIRLTREVADLMHKYGVSVEAELGHVGDAQAGHTSVMLRLGRAKVLLSAIKLMTIMSIQILLLLKSSLKELSVMLWQFQSVQLMVFTRLLRPCRLNF